MGRSILQTLGRRIQRRIAGCRFQPRHRVLYFPPSIPILRGFCLESSAFEAGAFYLWAFVQPLYVTHDYIFFTFGQRLADFGRTRWVANSENLGTVEDEVLRVIEKAGLPLVDMLDTPEKLARAAAKEPSSGGELWEWDKYDPNVTEDRAYSWILADQLDKARADLGFLLSESEYKPEEDWEFQIQKRAAQVRAALNRSPLEARALLMGWANDTAKKLQLESE
jgi:hypothetical protein